MEFLRFGSSIPGAYWGCCAVCIIQNFKVHPDEKYAIQMVDGDGGYPTGKYAGPTYRDVFNTRIRTGTFGVNDMANHTFFAVLTEEQLHGQIGKEWLSILKENGFEFVRTVDNSVYTGSIIPTVAGRKTSSHKNHIFALYRNIASGYVEDPFTPPKAWTDLPNPYSGDMSLENVRKIQTEFWESHGPTKLLSEAEAMEQAGLSNIWLAGKRSEYPQQTKTSREYVENAKKQAAEKAKAAKTAEDDAKKVIVAPAFPIPKIADAA